MIHISISYEINSNLHFAGDFSVRIFDLDTSDSFLLPMSQTKKVEIATEPIKTVEKKNSVGNLKSSRSVKSKRSRSTAEDEEDEEEEDDYGSDEEISFQMDDTELKVSTSAAAPKSVVEVFTCIAYCTENQTLCAGTNQGNLYIWKRNIQGILSGIENGGANGLDSMENFWHLVNVANVRGAIKYCCWGVCDVATPCVLVNCISNVFILKVSEGTIGNHSTSQKVCSNLLLMIDFILFCVKCRNNRC